MAAKLYWSLHPLDQLVYIHSHKQPVVRLKNISSINRRLSNCPIYGWMMNEWNETTSWSKRAHVALTDACVTRDVFLQSLAWEEQTELKSAHLRQGKDPRRPAGVNIAAAMVARRRLSDTKPLVAQQNDVELKRWFRSHWPREHFDLKWQNVLFLNSLNYVRVVKAGGNSYHIVHHVCLFQWSPSSEAKWRRWSFLWRRLTSSYLSGWATASSMNQCSTLSSLPGTSGWYDEKPFNYSMYCSKFLQLKVILSHIWLLGQIILEIIRENILSVIKMS